jgi:hypothetical protein
MNRQLPVIPYEQKTFRVTGSYLVIRSYWKFSGHLELLDVFWSLGVTGSFLVIWSYWKFSGYWESSNSNDQIISSNSP